MKKEREKMILAMEYIARQINDENVFEAWLANGVPDGDIEYGDFDYNNYDDEYFMENDNFADLMDTFLYCMAKARKSGGLFCDNVVSKAGE